MTGAGLPGFRASLLALSAVSALGVAALFLPASSAAAEAPAAGKTMGFAITWFQPALRYGDGDCPDGVNEELDWKAIFTKQGRSPAEIQNLLDHPVSPEFMEAELHRGPHGENVCADPASAPDTSWKTGKSRISYGMNLDGTADGAATAKTCKHEKFVGDNGEPGVDNQLYRVLACSKGHRGQGHAGFITNYLNERMREGMVTYLIEVSGVRDGRNDDDVQVAVYLGLDPLKQNAGGGVQSDMTLRVSADPRWHNTTHGRIKDGVLTTDAFDVNLPSDPLWIPGFNFKQARLRLELQADGSLKGILAGYHDWYPIYWGLAKTAYNYEKFSGGNCPAIYNAFQRMADGNPDPKTGQCSAISAAYGVEAVPAFLSHPKDAKANKTAQAGAPVSTAGLR